MFLRRILTHKISWAISEDTLFNGENLNAWFIYPLHTQDTCKVSDRVNEFGLQFISVYSTAKG
jgi:hypothetical protein